MSCSDVQRQLTAYLDGELADERGSAVRGHLRTCAACRQVAADEGALRDGLRQLPAVDVPPSLWANVQAQLAAAEVADAEKPGWRRALTRWSAAASRAWPQVAFGGVALAAVATFVIWRSHGRDEGNGASDAVVKPSMIETHAPAPSAPPPPRDRGDVTADLGGEAQRLTETYADAAEELLALATDARAQWTPAQQGEFDAHVAELRGAIEQAAAGRPQQAAWRALIRYLQRAVVREEIALASVGGAP